jgi:large subunit ribosomal protein L20
MTRVKTGKIRRTSHKRILKLAKGFYGSQSRLFRTANQRILKSQYYSYVDRKKNKRIFRNLWIIRINAASRLLGLSYNKIINNLKKNKILLNRKILSEIILRDQEIFKKVILLK